MYALRQRPEMTLRERKKNISSNPKGNHISNTKGIHLGLSYILFVDKAVFVQWEIRC